ncbi:MAG: thiamine-monophosphate kinase [Chloroflexi bacterium]|nr:MAG: thiamine-monophosphate kinase [Chloroflexota bacterium]
MNVEDLGEFGLIERLQSMIDARQGTINGLLLGIGDDAAAWKTVTGTEVASTDTMVAGVHFLPDKMPWDAIGWKAIASNLSDIAAMGCEPRFALVTLGLPPETPVAWLDALYEGMLDCTEAHGGTIVGGDIVASPVFFVTVSLTGFTTGLVMTRASAKAGDRIAVTGALGGSAGGLQLLLEKTSGDEPVTTSLLEAHFRPVPQVAAGLALVRAGITTAIDLSDGLVGDLERLCRASGVAARIEADAVPLHPALAKVFPNDSIQLALTGGEDYQLLFTAEEALLDKVRKVLPDPPVVIGTVVEGEPGQVDVLDEQGNIMVLPLTGWDHLRKSPA